MRTAEERASRLLRWYPGAWRARYGAEFAELLAAELSERPRAAKLTANVALSGLRVRLAQAGLTGYPLDQPAATRSGLATLARCALVFVIGGAAMWSQVAIGVQWARPRHESVTQSLDLMSVSLLVFAVVALLAVGRTALVAIRRRPGLALLRPGAIVLAGAAVLFFGARHFQNGWPGTGGHQLVHQGLVPAGVAAFCWAATMWVSSYLAHPAALAAFPAGQLAWMAISAIAAGAVIGATGRFLRRLNWSPGDLRYATWLGRAGSGAMLIYLGGAVLWLISPGGGMMPAFHVGSIDLAAMALLAVALLVNGQALRGTAAARLALTGTGDQ